MCFAAPLLFTAPAFDAPVLEWLGLGRSVPVTNDYVPVFPWFGFVLLGLAGGRQLRSTAARVGPVAAGWSNPVGRVLIWSGRRSLIIYLLHQPLLLGGLILLVQVTGPNPAAEEAFFRRNCEESCTRSGAGDSRCVTGCACSVEQLKGSGLWRQALTGSATLVEREHLSSITRQCFRQ